MVKVAGVQPAITVMITMDSDNPEFERGVMPDTPRNESNNEEAGTGRGAIKPIPRMHSGGQFPGTTSPPRTARPRKAASPIPPITVAFSVG
jgi:hypothetical protein